MKRTFKVSFLPSFPSAVTGRVPAGRGQTAKRSGAVGILGMIGLSSVMLFGCPIYSGSGNGNNGSGIYCDDSYGGCETCQSNNDCPVNDYCSQGYCVQPADAGNTFDSGSDGGSSCPDVPCGAGFQCTLTNGTSQCLPLSDAGSFDAGSGEGGGDATKPPTDATTDATVDAPLSSEGGRTDGPVADAGGDASDAESFPPFTGCTDDNACVADSGAGAKCINGACVAAANQCFDSTQCPSIGATQEECVQGVCTPSCAGGAACPAGYTCDPSGTNVCINGSPCGAADGGSVCGSGLTCVDEHCVPECTENSSDSGADAGSSCGGDGLICVDHGCIPNQEPNFICGADGEQSTCASGSICLHHSCYIACTLGDAGENTCAHADTFNECKPVTSSSGTYDVCGSSTNLGNECDPTRSIACTSPEICIDGYCH